MADQVDLDSLSDDDFMEMLESAANEPAVEETEVNIEDTDQVETEEVEEEESDTDHSSDDENVENEDAGDTGSGATDEENSQENDTEDNQEEDTEAPEPVDGEDTPIDYKKQYEEMAASSSALQSFYDEITSDIVVNGKKTKGFSDPKMIIQAQQMAGNYNEKMRGIKQYRKFMDPIKKRGFLDDPKKFDLAMQLLDGDPEALKQHVKDLEMDPFEFDMDNINYVPESQTSSDLELAYNDIMDNASKHGVEDRVSNTLHKDWDNESIAALLDDPQSSADLVQHMSNGVYDAVTNRMSEKQRVDMNGVYGNKPSIEQYREASAEIEHEYGQYVQQQQMQYQQQMQQQQAGQDEGQNQIEEDYKNQVSQENQKADDARRKATSVSKKKKKVQPKKVSEDPMDLSDEEFEKVISAMIYK